MIFQKYFDIVQEKSLYSIKIIDKYKVVIYIIYFIFFFTLYYLINIPHLSEGLNININYIIIICFDIFYIIGLTLLFIYYFKNFDIITKLKKNLIIIFSIYISGLLIFMNMISFSKYLIDISNSNITKIIFLILSSIFYILFLILFVYNINEEYNIEFLISLTVLCFFLFQYLLISLRGISNLYLKLKKTNLSTLTINCFENNSFENFSDNKNENNQLIDISKKYGDNYLKTMGNIPISFYNKKLDIYQDLLLKDFYYPGSYYSYLADSPLNGSPSLDALKIILSDYKCRIIHLDIYSDKSDPYDPKAKPVVRCEKMKYDATPLNFEDTLGIINKWAWINNDSNNLSYPLFLILNFNFDENNKNIYLKIYESLIKYFSKYFIDKKYGFSGRNNNFSISSAKIKDCLGKIILITNKYPTKTSLDELINTSTNELNNTFNLVEYKPSYISYDKLGISLDNDKTVLINNSKSYMSIYYSKPNEANKNNNQDKAGLFNPSFQDCAQYGIQSTLMYVFVPDENLNKWYNFFRIKNNFNPVLKDELLRTVNQELNVINSQNPVVGLQQSQKYCVVPGLISTEKSNLSSGVANSSCN